MTKREAAIVSAYTGVLIGCYGDLQQYVDRILDQHVPTYRMLDFFEEIKDASKADFLAITVEE